jgi:tRNA dimethylallyltransferase
MPDKLCIIVAGPTAAGKTAEAIRIAKSLDTEIVSADSRQCYRELNIGVARPTPEELDAVQHHFIANHSILEDISAASYAQEALVYLQKIFQHRDHAVVCGGTGLYIKALAEGLDEIPPVPEAIRNKIKHVFQVSGIAALREQLLELDPDFASHGDINNPNRLMRALEVVMHTGHPISSYQKGSKAKRNFKIEYKIIQPPRELLYEKINQRVDQMIAQGLEAEAHALLPYRERPALQTVGYKEFFDFFSGKLTRAEAIEKIKQHTRNYAKRQMTWFRTLQ